MATTLQPPETEPHDSSGNHGPTGGGGVSTLGPSGNVRLLDEFSPEPSRTGIWVGLAAISMCFAAFTSALIVRQATANDWHPLALPSIVFANTALLLASSTTLEIARRRVAAYAHNQLGDRSAAQFWLI